MAILGSATYKLDTDNSRLNRGLAKAEQTSRQSAKRIAGNFAKIGGGMLAVGAGIGLALFKLGGQASSLKESINAVNVVFGQGKKTILDFSSTASTVVGLASADFNQLSATTGALFTNFGLSEQEAAEETINLTKRAADLASVFNTDVGDALGALQAAVRGETEPLRRFAGDVTDASLELYLLEKGITRSVTEMTQAEKGLLRYEVAMAQTAKVEGDFQDTSEDAANAMRILKAQIKDAAALMGQGLLPVFEAVLPVVQSVVAQFAEWAESNPKLMRALVLGVAAVAGLAVVIGGLLLVAAGAMMVFAALGVAGLITVGWVALAMIALVAVGVWLVANWDKVKKSLVSVFDAVLAWVQPVVDAFAQWAENNPELMRALVIARQAVEGLTKALDWLLGKAQEAWEAIKEFAANIWEKHLKPIWGKFKEIWESSVEPAILWLVEKFEGLPGLLQLSLLGTAAALSASMTALLAVWSAKMLVHLAAWTATSLAHLAVWSAKMLAHFAVFTATSLARMALWPAKMLVHLAVFTATSLARMALWVAGMLARFALWTVTSLARMAVWVAKMLVELAVWTATSLANIAVWVAGMLARFALWTVTSLGEMVVWVAKMLVELAVWTGTSLVNMTVWTASMLARFAVWTATMLARTAAWVAGMLAELAVLDCHFTGSLRRVVGVNAGSHDGVGG